MARTIFNRYRKELVITVINRFIGRKATLLVFLVFVSLLTGCSSMIFREQRYPEGFVPLYEGRQIGQTIVAEFDGLEGFQVYLTPVETGGGSIILTAMPSPDSSKSLGRAMLSMDEISEARYYRINFSPIKSSYNQDYYLMLTYSGSGSVNIGTSSLFSYLNGAIYIDGTPADQQMVFNLVYDPVWAGLGILKEALIWIGYSLLATLLFVIPGWGLLSALWHAWDNRTSMEKLLLSAGLTMAIYPLLLLWADVFGLQPGVWLAVIPVFAGVLLILYQNRKNIKIKSLFTNANKEPLTRKPVIILLVLAGIIAVTRFWPIRIIDVPLWGDSYHHTMISQLIVDNRGLFDSWEPYAELSSFTYHFGFHTNTAIFHWFTNLGLPESVLWFGQVLNTLAVLVLYPLAVKLGRSQWAGVVAVLFSGLMISMPMYYVNWGRYTQLAGQVILPVALYLLWDIAERQERSWGTIFIVSILLSGLALTHYRVLFFALIFFLVIFLFQLRGKNIFFLLKNIIFIGAISLFLFLPWFVNVFGSTILEIFGEQITTSAGSLSQSTLDYNTIGDLTNYLPVWAWIATGIAAVVGLVMRPKSTLLVIIWCLTLLVAANPHWVRLPGAGILSNFALFIAVYVPAGLLVGSSAGALIEEVLKKRSNVYTFVAGGVSLIILALAIWGAWKRLGDVDQRTYALVTRPDVRAMNWIEDTTPIQAKFLVNSFLAYDGTLAVGSDGGLWLPLLADRKSTLPPITYGFEQSTMDEKISRTNQLIQEVMNLGASNPEAVEILRENEVTHIYIGQRRGSVNYSGTDILDPSKLAASPNYQPIYHEDLVWIFRLIP